MTDPSSGPPSGWYPDPQGPPGQERWWDSSGGKWAEFTRNGPPHQRASGRPVDTGLLVAAAGAAALLLGPFGPWVTALGGIVSRSGVDATDLDAWAIVALAIGCGILVYQWYASGDLKELTLMLSAGGAGGLAVYHYIDIVQNHDELGVGWGLYLSIAGAGVLVITGALAVAGRR